LEEIIRLRGHHILCLLGFRGLGYSDTFVENMTRVQSRVFSHNCLIEIVSGPDDICSCCPRLAEKCSKKDAGSRINAKDAAVLERISLSPDTQITSEELYKRIAESIAPEDLEVICKRCKWRKLGYCADGIRRIRENSNR
jgi:hypothetical protein